eukprot:260352-Chlamydomonas_euryale.AAC.3
MHAVAPSCLRRDQAGPCNPPFPYSWAGRCNPPFPYSWAGQCNLPRSHAPPRCPAHPFSFQQQQAAVFPRRQMPRNLFTACASNAKEPLHGVCKQCQGACHPNVGISCNTTTIPPPPPPPPPWMLTGLVAEAFLECGLGAGASWEPNPGYDLSELCQASSKLTNFVCFDGSMLRLGPSSGKDKLKHA